MMSKSPNGLFFDVASFLNRPVMDDSFVVFWRILCVRVQLLCVARVVIWWLRASVLPFELANQSLALLIG